MAQLLQACFFLAYLGFALGAVWIVAMIVLSVVHHPELERYRPAKATEAKGDAKTLSTWGLVRYPGFGIVFSPPRPMSVRPDEISFRGAQGDSGIGTLAYRREDVRALSITAHGPCSMLRLDPREGLPLGFLVRDGRNLGRRLRQQGWPVIEAATYEPEP